MSTQPAIIFRLEMAQPLYVIAQVACEASSRVFAAKYSSRVVCNYTLLSHVSIGRPAASYPPSTLLPVAVSLESAQI